MAKSAGGSERGQPTFVERALRAKRIQEQRVIRARKVLKVNDMLKREVPRIKNNFKKPRKTK